VRIVPLSADAAERFADIRASTRVKPADALHLALAASAGADYFVTYDTKLHSVSVPGIAKICPPDAVP
jgi:predicted nucleic acid-binding protein